MKLHCQSMEATPHARAHRPGSGSKTVEQVSRPLLAGLNPAPRGFETTSSGIPAARPSSSAPRSVSVEIAGTQDAAAQHQDDVATRARPVLRLALRPRRDLRGTSIHSDLARGRGTGSLSSRRPVTWSSTARRISRRTSGSVRPATPTPGRSDTYAAYLCVALSMTIR
jgi:hypothetical protein